MCIGSEALGQCAPPRNTRGRGFSGHYALPPMERFEMNPERARDQSEEPKNGQKRPPPLLKVTNEFMMPVAEHDFDDHSSRLMQNDGELTPLSGHKALYDERREYCESRRWMDADQEGRNEGSLDSCQGHMIRSQREQMLSPRASNEVGDVLAQLQNSQYQ